MTDSEINAQCELNQAAQTPLPELLRRVPKDITIGMQLDRITFGAPYHHFPVGYMCHEAADLIEQQAREIELLRSRAIGYMLPSMNQVMVPLEDTLKIEAERDAMRVEIAGLRKELDGLREIAANPLAIQKVRDALGPLSLWSASGFEQEVARRIDAAMREGK